MEKHMKEANKDSKLNIFAKIKELFKRNKI